MTLNQILYFHRAATLEHFNLAAESLHISEPSLSRSIASLEQELGTALFEKKGRNVSLTKAGQLFLEQATIILDDISTARIRMHEYTNSGGQVVIAYVAPLAHWFLPSLIKHFKQSVDNRNIQFHFYEGYTDENIKGLREKKYDLAFGSSKEDESDIVFIPILKQEMVVLLPKDHPMANEKYIDHTIFSKYPVLCYDPTSGLGKTTVNYFKEYNVNPNVASTFPDEESLAAFVADGFGIALASDSKPIYREDIVVKHLIPEEQFMHTIYMAYLKYAVQMPSVRKMIEYVKQQAEMTRAI